MTNVAELYQELILDHGRRPRNFMISADANCVLEGFNPLCGDRVMIYVTEKNGQIEKVTFQGNGCAISMASASLMSEALQGKTLAQAKALFSDFHQLVTDGTTSNEEVATGKLNALAGVAEFPARVKCATLAWHTLLAAINQEKQGELCN